MAFDEQLGVRIGHLLDRRTTEYTEKRMFGGLGFMINDKMCIGVVKDDLMLRVLPERFDEVLATPNVREMEFTGRPMKGFVFVESAGIETDEALDVWIGHAIDFGKLGIVKSKPKKK
jgi:hypothetical protein